VELQVAAAVLCAALLHAGWNALVRINTDRLAALTLMAVGAGVVALATLPFVPVPAAAAWPWLAVTLVVHTVYKLCLLRAYGSGEFGHVYPLARGTAPLLVTLASLVFVGEHLAGTTLAAVLLLSAGVISLAFRGGRVPFAEDPQPVLWALGTGFCIATYSVLDALGARAAGTGHGFVAWLFVFDAVPMLALTFWRRRGATLVAMRRHWRPGLIGGAMSLTAYWLVIVAMTVAPMAPVSALRETSVLFAALISVVALGERFDRVRLLASICVVAGICLLAV
jgi:drug/metabolite transporter (DMT)-like permease